VFYLSRQQKVFYIVNFFKSVDPSFIM